MSSTVIAEFHIPCNLDLEQLLKGRRKDQAENLMWSICYILDTIHALSQLKKFNDEYEKFGEYPLNASKMKEKLGSRYKDALSILENHLVIYRSSSYSTIHSRSKTVKLREKYETASIIKKTLTASTPFSTQLAKIRNEHLKINEDALEELTHITKWFNRECLQLDMKKAHVFIEQYRMQLNSHANFKEFSKEVKHTTSQRINARANNMITSMEQLRLGNYQLRRTGKDKRLHSILTSTKKELRPLYTYKGKPLVSVDIKASQPYFLNTLLDSTFWSEKVEKIYPLLHSTLSTSPLLSHPVSDYMLLTFERGDLPYKSSYKLIEWNKGFYEYLMERAILEGKYEIFPTRSRTKGVVMNLLYNKESYMSLTPHFHLLKGWFPEVTHLVKTLTELSREASRELKEEFNFLPVLLQRIESHVVLDIICKTISEVNADIPLYPIHDSILTTKEYVGVVRSVMEKELLDYVGVAPGLTIESYDEQTALDNLPNLVSEDFKEITKSAGVIIPRIPLKKPLLYTFPSIDGKEWLATRYISTNMMDYE
jgi:hypothetical protein